MKPERILLFVTCLVTFLGGPVLGQERAFLSGTVTDALSGGPLAGATIYVHGANTGVVADEHGNYHTSAIAPGRYTVEISCAGFQSNIQTVMITGTTDLDVALSPSVVEEEGVTVTGVSTATRLRQVPQPVSLIRNEELMKMSTTNIVDAIAHVPGVNAVTTGPAIAKPFIRGLGYNRVVTIHDGVRQEGQQWGDEHGIEIDDYSVQRIEVLKGPASLMYGSDALAGVINIQSLVPAPDGVIRGNIMGEYQTNSRLRGFYAAASGTRNGFSFSTYGSYKAAADYRNRYDGPVFNSRFHNEDAGAMVGYRGSWGSSYLSFTAFNQHAGIIEGDRDPVTGAFVQAGPGGTELIPSGSDFRHIDPEVPYQHIRHVKVTSTNQVNINSHKLEITLGYQQNQRQEFGNPDATDVPDAFFDLRTLTYAARLSFPYRANWRTTVGVGGMYQANSNRAEETLIPDYHLLDAGAFLYTQYHKGKLFLSGGLRADNRTIHSMEMLDGNTIKFESFSRSFGNISGSAGLSYLASKSLSVKFNIARGFRAPSLAELASNGAHEGTNRFEVGDRTLPSETGLQADLGAEVNTQHITLSASLYYNRISHFIFYERVRSQNGGDSVLTDPVSGNELQVFQFLGENARLYGFEFNMDIHPHPLDWLHVENTFSLTRARFASAIDGSVNVPLIPAARYILQLKGNFLPGGTAVRNIYVGLESDYTFCQGHPFTGYGTETATSGYWLVNVSAGADIRQKGKTLFSIHFTGSNLGDIAYQNHLSRLKYTAENNRTGRMGVFNTGRNFGVRINVPLDAEWK